MGAADRLIDEFLDTGACEMVGDYAEPFTLTVIADLEGVPEADHSPVPRAPVDGARGKIAHKPLEFLYERFTGYIEDRRQNPRDDVLTGLATATFPDGSTPEVQRRGADRRQPLRRRPGDHGAAALFRAADAR